MTDDETSATFPDASAHPRLDPPGALARYQLGTVLGRGGMGEVVSARDAQLGRSVAIKRMRAADPEPEMLARFLREAKIQGCLDHPAIVPVHELSTDSTGAPFFVMKQLSGVTLAEVIEKLGAGDATIGAEFTRQRLLRAFAEVCLAIEFAHMRGIVHRDLKPSNIVLGEFGEVYVLDWGIAKVIGDPEGAPRDIATLDEGDTVEGAILGTPGYMSPEQIRGDAELDGRADVYALGCILFEILALRPLHPRGAAGLGSAIAGIEARPSKRAPDRDIAPELDAACAMATALVRGDRFATARALGDAVQRFLDGDRDIARRRELALGALAEARVALERDPADGHGDAMRAAGRALALDPSVSGAAELLSNLMLQPPAVPPPEVESELARADVEGQLATRKLTAIAGWGYLLFLPIMVWIGFAPRQLALVAIAAVVMIAIGRLVTLDNLTWMSRLAVALHAFMIVLATRYTSPFLLAPAMGVIVAMANSTLNRLARPITMAGVFVAAALGPFALEQLGVISPTVAISGNQVIVAVAADPADPLAVTFGLAVFVSGVIVFGAVLARQLVEQRRVALRQTKLHSWRLQQLIQRGETRNPSPLAVVP